MVPGQALENTDSAEGVEEDNMKVQTGGDRACGD